MLAAKKTVRSAKEFTLWAAASRPGETVTYHIGNLGVDRAESPQLHLLAETVLLLAETGFVSTRQLVMRISTGSPTWYCASRTGSGWAPRSILSGSIDAHTYRALQALNERPADLSAQRAIRDHMGCAENTAADFLAVLWGFGLIEAAQPRGYQLTSNGRRALV